MEIEKQSNQCKKNNETSTEPIGYDGNSCGSQDERVESTTENVEVKSKKSQVAYPDPDVEIHGFLKFILVMMFIGGLSSALIPIMTYHAAKYADGGFYALGEVIFGILFFFLTCYTIFSFLKRRPNAVFLAKTFACVLFACNLLDHVSSGAVGNPFVIIVSLVYPIIIFLYVTFSEQVQDMIPKSYRKPFKCDYFLIAILIIVPVLFVVLGVKEDFSKQERQEQEFIEAANLKEGEYTDGRIIFTVPEGFICEEFETEEEPKISAFNLESENIYMQVMSCYDMYMQTVIASDKKSMKYFEECWDVWQYLDKGLKDIPYVEIKKKKMKANGNPFYLKSVRYEMEQPIVCHFGLIFHVPTSKLCIISSVQLEDESINDFVKLIETIRFSN